MACIPVIDESVCIAHGDCEEQAPEVFRVGDVASVIGTAPEAQLLAIAEGCPVEAISVVDEETGQQVYP
jgi:ferredoxin